HQAEPLAGPGPVAAPGLRAAAARHRSPPAPARSDTPGRRARAPADGRPARPGGPRLSRRRSRGGGGIPQRPLRHDQRSRPAEGRAQRPRRLAAMMAAMMMAAMVRRSRYRISGLPALIL